MSNKYLEKVAATFEMKPHSSDAKYKGVKSVGVSKEEYSRYSKAKGVNPGVEIGGVAAGAFLGHRVGKAATKPAVASYIAKSLHAGTDQRMIRAVGKQTVAVGGLVGAVAGAKLVAKAIDSYSHNKKMKASGLTVSKETY